MTAITRTSAAALAVFGVAMIGTLSSIPGSAGQWLFALAAGLSGMAAIAEAMEADRHA